MFQSSPGVLLSPDEVGPSRAGRSWYKTATTGTEEGLKACEQLLQGVIREPEEGGGPITLATAP